MSSISVFSACKIIDKIFPQISPKELETLRAICSNLTVPDSFVKIRERKIEKPEVVTYTTEYSSTTDNSIVKRHFVDLLVPQGWEYLQETEIGESNLFFQKDKFLIGVYCQTLSFTSDKKCQVSCSWGISK